MKNHPITHLASLMLIIFLCSCNIAHAKSSKIYVINIASSLKPFKSSHLPVTNLKGSHRFYTVRLKFKNQIWNRLRLGFFHDKKSANFALKQVRKSYPDAFIGIVKKQETRTSKNTEIVHSIYPVEYLIFKTADLLLDSAPSLKLKQDKKQQNDPAPTREPDSYYIISLKTASNLNDFDKVINNPVVSRWSLYISDLEIDNRTWYQYRMGFFISKDEANQQLSLLEKDFPLARLIKISTTEKKIATTKIRAFTAATSPRLSLKRKAPARDPVKVYQELIKQGTKALSQRNYNAAIVAFSKILSYPENSYSKDAQELLGFSYELNGQIAEARREYERYISLYPESSGAVRVQQRIASMITARKPAPRKLVDAKKMDKEEDWTFNGSISQFYRRDTSSIDISSETDTTVIRTTDKRVNLSEIDTLLNINGRKRGVNSEIRTRLTGGHIYNLRDTDESNKAPLNELYIDYLNLNNQFSARFGRQTANKGGVFGRFDGLDTGYQLSDWFRINLTTGYQVNSVYHSADSDTFFTSLRGDFGTFLNAWDFSLYYFKQQQGELTGREAIGTEFRYFHPQRSLFGLIDHDILFDRTNTALITGTWITDSRVSYNATIDYRLTPLLNIRNATIGQTVRDVEDMLASFTAEELIDIANDRTAEVKSIIAGLSYPVNERYTFNTDITSTRISATTASAGVEALPESGPDHHINLQLVGTSVFYEADSNITGLSFSSTDTSDTLSLRWNYRVPVNQKLRLNPRLTLSERENSNDTEQSILGMAFKLDYRFGRRTSFELELGGESSDRTLVSGEEKNKVYFLNLGYQHNF